MTKTTNETLNQKATRVLENMIKKWDQDPNYRQKILAEMALANTHKDSQLICSVIDSNYIVDSSVGDLLMYGMDHNYPDTLTQKAHNLFYQWHGCGD